jgi:F0F1-type ATP synthase delta subunit
MKIPRHRIARVVANHILKHGVSRDYARELAGYLLTERRVKELDSLLRDVQSDWADAGYVEVITKSAHPLSQTAKAEIDSKVRQLYPDAKQIIVTEAHDAELIGGVQLNLPGQQLDLSVKAKLNQFTQLTTAGKD